MILLTAVTACSTSGGIYKQGDPSHGEFSAEKTILTVIGVIGAALVAKSNSGGDGNNYIPYQYDDTTNSKINPITPSTKESIEAVTTSTNEEQLAELKQLFDKNLITKEVYFERQNMIMRTLGQ